MRQPFVVFVSPLKRTSIAGALGAALLSILTIITPSSVSAEWISIKHLLGNPSSYAMHIVTIRGVLRGLVFLPDFPIRGCLSPGAYRLTVDDETGVLEVLVSSQPMNPSNGMSAGDNVELDVLVYPVKKENASIAIEAVAKQVKKLGGN
jgi:hypothetical protein